MKRSVALERSSQFLAEHLQCYAVVGYDFDGTPMHAVRYRNVLEEDALKQFARDLLDLLEERSQMALDEEQEEGG